MNDKKDDGKKYPYRIYGTMPYRPIEETVIVVHTMSGRKFEATPIMLQQLPHYMELFSPQDRIRIANCFLQDAGGRTIFNKAILHPRHNEIIHYER